MPWTESSILYPRIDLLFDFFLLQFSMDTDNQAPNVTSQQSSTTSACSTVIPIYSCFLPTPLDGTTDYEDFVT